MLWESKLEYVCGFPTEIVPETKSGRIADALSVGIHAVPQTGFKKRVTRTRNMPFPSEHSVAYAEVWVDQDA